MNNAQDVTLLSSLLDNNNDENIVLFDDAGEPNEFEQIAIIPYEKELFAILRPIDEDEDAAVVYKVSTDDEDSLLPVEEKLALKILEIYNSGIA